MKDKAAGGSDGARGPGLARRSLIGGIAAATLIRPRIGEAAAAGPVASTLPRPAPPGGLVHNGVVDVHLDFAQLTARAPDDAAFRAAFIQSKMRIAASDPTLDEAGRARIVAALAQRLGAAAEARMTQPPPGGVGYGPFYTDAFKAAWGAGTSVTCEYVCPTPPGGNVNTWLYLTTTNRSGLGVEAFVSYYGQGEARFKVFDWARTDQWQTDIGFSSLANYLARKKSHGVTYQVLPVWNSTWRVSGSSWRNEALLYNRVRKGWDLIYQYDYTATEEQQKGAWIGSWGPIVETFQARYSRTKPMGALATRLISADAAGVWGSWATLKAANSYIRNDGVGFRRVFLDPNYAFVVKS